MIAGACITELTDGELMTSIADGKMEPLGEIYRRYGKAVRSLLWRLLPDEPSFEAEDLCQEVFMTVYEIAKRFDVCCDLRPWLFGIAVKKARSRQRQIWLRRRILRTLPGKVEIQGYSLNPFLDDSTGMRHEIGKALKSIPEAQREVLILYVAHHMNGDQIAEALRIPLNTVWTRLRRARIGVRTVLQRSKIKIDFDMGKEKQNGKLPQS